VKLSIVSTLYKSEKHVDEFFRRVTESARKLVQDNYEIILVNDGSPDNSLELATQLSSTDAHLKVIDLSRNFGHHKAMMAGLSYARGEQIFLIDSDLEEQPEWLLEFSKELDTKECDVVFGVQASRKGGVFERFSGWLFYKIFNSVSELALPKNLVTARLMTRRYLSAFLLHEEREISIGGLFLVTGFVQQSYTVRKLDTSDSTYTFGRKMAVMVDSITSFSNKPLVGIFYIGLVILLLASVNVGYLVLNWMMFSTPLSGWTSVMASIWFLGGLVVLFIGIVGIYLSKIFTEVKQRPNSIVKHVYNSEDG